MITTRSTAPDHVEAPAACPAEWLAAYSIGLAYSGRDPGTVIDLLVAAAAGDRGILQATYHRLAHTHLADASVRRSAIRLVRAAVATGPRSRDGSSQGDVTAGEAARGAAPRSVAVPD